MLNRQYAPYFGLTQDYRAKAYYLDPVMEPPSGKGFADGVYLPRRNVEKPAWIVKLKSKKSPAGAIRQIKERHAGLKDMK